MLRLASASGRLKLGRLALDGTKIKAFSEIASRHKAMSYDRMRIEEARLQQEIRELLAQAEAEDQSDDAQHGANRRGDELPDELQRRESRLKKIRAAQAALEAEARGPPPRTKPRTPLVPPRARNRSRSTSTRRSRIRRLNATSPTPTRRS